VNELITGDQHEIASGPYRAVITEAGASLRELTHEQRPLILSHPEDEIAPAAFGQLLVPWPNRVDRGRYTYGGKEHQLDISEPKFDCAIHGLVRWAPWSLAERRPDRVVLTTRLLGSGGYPFRLDLEADYTLDPGEGLTVRLTATNTGRSAAPYGHGAHPYITVGEPLDGCTVSIPGDRYLAVDERMIPDGPPRKVEGSAHDFREARTLGDMRIDNAYTGLSRDSGGRAWVHLTGAEHRTSFWLDEVHPWLEIFTADTIPAGVRRQGLGVEPMTCPPDAFNSGTDLIDLAPGDQFSGSWGIEAG